MAKMNFGTGINMNPVRQQWPLPRAVGAAPAPQGDRAPAPEAATPRPLETGELNEKPWKRKKPTYVQRSTVLSQLGASDTLG